jgi:hypothetical protein
MNRGEKTREEDERDLLMLRLWERGVGSPELARRFGFKGAPAVRTVLQRIEKDYAKSEARGQ